MIILLTNKFHYLQGGDCIHILNLEQLLKEYGHEVAIFAINYPKNMNTPWNRYFPSNMSRLNVYTRPFRSNEVILPCCYSST